MSSAIVVLLLVIIIAAGACLLWWSPWSAKEIRNILLISMDTCRADHLSCYGYPLDTTPNIDAIAAEGTVFLDVFTVFPNRGGANTRNFSA